MVSVDVKHHVYFTTKLQVSFFVCFVCVFLLIVQKTCCTAVGGEVIVRETDGVFKLCPNFHSVEREVGLKTRSETKLAFCEDSELCNHVAMNGRSARETLTEYSVIIQTSTSSSPR